MNKKIVITGNGVLSPLGIGVDNFIKNIQKVNRPIEITTFNTDKFSLKKAFSMNDFDPKLILGEKGLRNFNRNTTFILSVLKNEFEKDITDSKENKTKLGLTIGTAFGSLQSISDYELDIFEKGPKKINPMGFGNTVINSPASRANIWFELTAQSSTVTCGDISGAKAIEFSINQIINGNADSILCGGSEELNMQTFLGYYVNGYLSDNEELSVYENGNHTILSEGCAVVLLKEKDTAIKNKDKILGEILGFSTSFYASSDNKKNLNTNGIVKALKDSLTNSNCSIGDIDVIITSSNGLKQFSDMEEKALIEVFGDELENKLIVPSKSLVGETIGAANLFQMVIGLNINKINELPVVCKYDVKQKKLINLKNFKINHSNFQKILLNCSSMCGNHSAIILQIEK